MLEMNLQKNLDTTGMMCPWLEKIGYSEMLDHKFLTPDRKVQESKFSSGWAVIVNFNSRQSGVHYKFSDKIKIEPFSYHIYKWK